MHWSFFLFVLVALAGWLTGVIASASSRCPAWIRDV